MVVVAPTSGTTLEAIATGTVPRDMDVILCGTTVEAAPQGETEVEANACGTSVARGAIYSRG